MGRAERCDPGASERSRRRGSRPDPWGKRRRRGGEGPEPLQSGVELPAELERVEALIQSVERLARFGLEDAGSAEALVRRLGAIIDAPDAAADADARDELLHRLEEVHVQPQETIHHAEGRVGGLGGVAIIADPATDDGAVLLLDVRAVVLPIGPPPGEGDALPLAVVPEQLVDELGARITVPAEQGHRQALAGVMNRAAHALLALAPHRLELGPTGDDVDGAQGTEVEAEGAGPAVGDEIAFEEAGARIVPVGKGADGDLVFEPRARTRDSAPARRPRGAGGREEALEGGGADAAQGGVRLGVQPHSPAGDQPVQQLRDKGLQAHSPDLPAGVPEHLGRGGDVRPVHARPPGPGCPRRRARRAVQAAQGRLAVVASHRDHFIQDPALGAPGRRQVPRPLRGHVLMDARPRHGHLPLGIGSGNRYL